MAPAWPGAGPPGRWGEGRRAWDAPTDCPRSGRGGLAPRIPDLTSDGVTQAAAAARADASTPWRPRTATQTMRTTCTGHCSVAAAAVADVAAAVVVVVVVVAVADVAAAIVAAAAFCGDGGANGGGGWSCGENDGHRCGGTTGEAGAGRRHRGASRRSPPAFRPGPWLCHSTWRRCCQRHWWGRGQAAQTSRVLQRRGAPRTSCPSRRRGRHWCGRCQSGGWGHGSAAAAPG